MDENLYDTLIAEIKKFGMANISQKSGIPLRTIQEWVYHHRIPSLINAEDCFNALGFALKLEKVHNE